MTFNAKNLTYESNEPAFLRKLKSEYDGTDSTRHQRPQVRPKKQKTTLVDEEEPVYVHEEDPHEPISKTEYDALLNSQISKDHDGLFTGEEAQPSENVVPHNQTEHPPNSYPEGELHPKTLPQQQMAVIGTASKRRLARPIGAEADTEDAQGCKEEMGKGAKRVPKKVKRQKLSFQDD